MQLSDDEKHALGDAMAMSDQDARARAVAKPHQLVQPGAEGRAALSLAERAGAAAARSIAISLVAETRVAWDIQPSSPELVSQPAMHLASASMALNLETQHGPGVLLLSNGFASALVRAVLGVGSPTDEVDGAVEAPTTLGVADRPVVARLARLFAHEVADRIVAEGGGLLRAGARVDALTRVTLPRGPSVALALRFAAPIEGVVELLLPVRIAGESPRPVGGGRIANHIPALEVDVVVELGRARLRLSELANLQPGMELTLDTHEHSLLPVCVDGKQRFLGKPIASEGRLSVQIALKESPGAPMKAARDTPPRQR